MISGTPAIFNQIVPWGNFSLGLSSLKILLNLHFYSRLIHRFTQLRITTKRTKFSVTATVKHIGWCHQKSEKVKFWATSLNESKQAKSEVEMIAYQIVDQFAFEMKVFAISSLLETPSKETALLISLTRSAFHVWKLAFLNVLSRLVLNFGRKWNFCWFSFLDVRSSNDV